MAVAFYSDDSGPIDRKVSLSSAYRQDKTLEDFYELDNCVEWITHNNFSKVALQFPDSLLSDAASIALKLEESTGKRMFILGDTSYGSCCVDEIAAEHAAADCVVHFGHACLSKTKRLPVLFVFGKSSIDIVDAACGFRKCFPDVTSCVVLIYEVIYLHAIEYLVANLKEYENLVVSYLDIPSKEESNSIYSTAEMKIIFCKCQRHIVIPKSRILNDYSAFYIGIHDQTLTNIMLSFSECKFYTYNPDKKVAQPETLDINKYLKKRYYYIEKTKDSQIIGILVGTLGVSKYLSIISHLRKLIKVAGKKCYTLVVGKLNTAKLANFPEIEVFVNVACADSSVIDCREFYQPIITPYELEIALNQARAWTGDYITDFSELLPGSAKHIAPSDIKRFEADVSLITGKMRSSVLDAPSEEQSDETAALVSRDEMKVSAIHSQAAGEFLSQRTWQGLEQNLGETEVVEVQQGRKGIACQYEDETHEQN